MVDSKLDTIKSVRQRRYLNKEFAELKNDLLEYARAYYGDKLADFSDSSLGGLLLDMPAYVGDVLSFYLDHQFSELDIETAVETQNQERGLRRAGVDIAGASPSVVILTYLVEVPAATENGLLVPMSSALPVVEAGTISRSDNGIDFELLSDVDFTSRDVDDNLRAKYVIGTTNASGVPLTFILAANGLAVSGRNSTENFTFDGFVPFRRITLANSNVTRIHSVVDSLGNTYYEVGNLTEDVVYKRIPNPRYDNEKVPAALQLLPVPYRYTTEVSLEERATTLIFGGGSADTLEDDAVPDPSLFAMPLYGKTTYPRSVLNPQKFLDTKTLGVSASDVSLTISYRSGGGSSHNVEANSIKTVTTLNTRFQVTPSAQVANAVRASVSVTNRKKSSGGSDALSVEELKNLVPLVRASQSRIVSQPDLIARVYTMPSDFGRPFRVTARSSPSNPLATQLHIVCRDSDGTLTMATDTLKDNLRVHLNEYRMVSDAIDIVDGAIVNIKVNYEISTESTSQNKRLVLQQIDGKLRKFFDQKNFSLDQPIVISDVHNIIFNTPGVSSVNYIKIVNLAGTANGRVYSDVYHDVQAHTTRGVLIPPPGGIFECKYPDDDLIGKAV